MDKVLLVPNHVPQMIDALKGKYELFHMIDAHSPAGVAGLDPAAIRVLVGKGSAPVSARLIEALPNLKVVSIFGVGYDGVDVAAATKHGVKVTHTPGVLTDEVANLAVGLAMAVTRRIPETDAFNRAGRWQKESPKLGTSVYGKTAGILGLGRIGRGIAERMKACGSKIAYSDVAKAADVDYDFYPDAVSLAKASDIFFVTCFMSEATRKIVNAEVLNALGPKGYVINTARGPIVDEQALIAALKDKRIGGAALDVYEEEPTFPAELAKLENTVITPHIGSSTYETRERMADLVVKNVEAFFAGKPLVTVIPEQR
jgi:hydroxypyruvate reductase 2